MLVIRQALQVRLRTAEKNGVSECTGSSDIIDDLLTRHAEEIIIETLQVGLFRKGQTLQIRNSADGGWVNMLLLEQAAVIRRMSSKIGHLLAQQVLLILTNRFY